MAALDHGHRDVTADQYQATEQAALLAALQPVAAAIGGRPGETPSGALPCAALERICTAFGLSRFERSVLLLCAASAPGQQHRGCLCCRARRSRPGLRHVRPGTRHIARGALERRECGAAAALLAAGGDTRGRPWRPAACVSVNAFCTVSSAWRADERRSRASSSGWPRNRWRCWRKRSAASGWTRCCATACGSVYRADRSPATRGGCLRRSCSRPAPWLLRASDIPAQAMDRRATARL